MKARREKKTAKNRRTTFHHDTQVSTSRNQDEDGDERDPDSDVIPLDITIDILTRLPAKSLVRFLCVSKLWESIIRSQDFVDSFLTRSLTRPRLLFTVIGNGKYVFFSAAHLMEADSESSCVANYVCDMKWSTAWIHLVRHLVCCGSPPNLAICNPTTNQFVTLPKVKSRRKNIYSFFGYDPIGDEYKVLCMTIANKQYIAEEHQVLTLGARKTWRKIECSIPHWPQTEGSCINGVLYYGAWYLYGVRHAEEDVIMSFDIRSEKFNLIKVPEGLRLAWSEHPTLINYNGKLACLSYGRQGIVDGTRIHLWVLEDAEKQEWSKKSCVFPPTWNDSIQDDVLSFAGSIGNGDFVLTPRRLSIPLYVFYYNMERNAVRRVVIEGIAKHEVMRQYKHWHLQISTDYVESIEFL